jgi:hypothetical protein
MPKVSNHPLGQNASNLVTLTASEAGILKNIVSAKSRKTAAQSPSRLPDGIFSHQKSQFG